MNSKVVNKNPTTQRESFSELLGHLAKDLTAAVHGEIEFVMQGIREDVRAVSSGVLTVAIGALISFAAFMCLCAALIIKLKSYMALVIAALVTGSALAFIGFVIVFIGYKKLKKSISKN